MSHIKHAARLCKCKYSKLLDPSTQVTSQSHYTEPTGSLPLYIVRCTASSNTYNNIPLLTIIHRPHYTCTTSLVHTWWRPTRPKCLAIKLVFTLLHTCSRSVHLYQHHNNEPLQHYTLYVVTISNNQFVSNFLTWRIELQPVVRI